MQDRNQTIPQIVLRKKDEPNKNWIFGAKKMVIHLLLLFHPIEYYDVIRIYFDGNSMEMRNSLATFVRGNSRGLPNIPIVNLKKRPISMPM